ncbi:MAG: CRTAC1 family protein [Planctomycetota bacterium]|jgi:hypothetical protein
MRANSIVLGTPAIVLCAATVLEAGTPGATLNFTEVTETAGIGLKDRLVESVAWGDYDNDGDPDLYLTGDGGSWLYRNDGNDNFTDVTRVAGVASLGFSVGTAFADLDNDGDLDLYVVQFSVGPDLLYRNNGPVGPGGAYTFTDIAASAGTTIERSSRGMAFLDYNRDGLLDIYVMSIGASMLYENQGDLQFVDVAGALGVEATATGVGVVCSDVDNNGWVDIFTGNRSGDPNRLFLNTGGAFTDATASAGITATGLGMGVLAFDYDNDLKMDLYWTTWPGAGEPGVANALYRNVDGSSFTDEALDSGTQDVTGWGISCNAGDIDLDGWQDFFVTNGFSDASTANVLFHNQGGSAFADVTAVLGGGAFDGRGAAFADYDGDGDLDLCVTADAGEETHLWRNDTVTSNHWLRVELLGRSSNYSAVGARVEVTAGGATTVQEVSGGAGRGSFNSLPVEFGLGAAASVEQIVIRWPNGHVQTLPGVAADQAIQVIEPDITGGPEIDVVDFLFLLAAWGQAGSPADLDNDGIVGVTDFLILLARAP